MQARWSGDKTADPGAMASSFLVHPNDCEWQHPIVLAWKAGHAAEIARGESATEMEALRKQHEQDLRDKIKQIRKRSRQVADYVEKSAEIISGEPARGKK